MASRLIETIRQQSMEESAGERFTRDISGRRPKGGTGTATPAASFEQQRKSEQERKSAELAAQVEAKKQEQLNTAQEQFMNRLRTAKGINQKVAAERDFNQRINSINLAAERQKTNLLRTGAINPTESQLVSASSRQLTELRKAAGTFGQDINPLVERGILKRFQEEGVTMEPQAGASAIISERKPSGVMTTFKPLTLEEQRRSKVLEVGSAVSGFIKGGVNVGKRLEEGIPTAEGGLLGQELLGRELVNQKQLIPFTTEDFVETTKPIPFTQTGKGTTQLLVSGREKTFFEKYGLNPNDTDALNLKNKIAEVQDRYSQGLIDENEADEEIEQASSDFEKKKVIQGLPKNVAVGAAMGIATSFLAPGVGTALGGLFLIDTVLRRRELVAQAKRVGLGLTTLQQASFLVGGLAGSAAGGTARGIFTKPKINIAVDELAARTNIIGNERTKFLSRVQELVEPDIKTDIKVGKITDTNFYKVTTKDGRVFNILEFTRLSTGAMKAGLKGTREFVGLELKQAAEGKSPIKLFPKGNIGFQKRGALELGDTIIGRGVSVINDGVTETYVRAFKFRPADNKLVKMLQRFDSKKRGLALEVVERSKATGSMGNRRASVSGVSSETRVLSVERISKEMFKQLSNLKKKIDKGSKLSTAEIRRVINIDKRLNGEKPFTELEFRKSTMPSVTDSTIIRILNRAKATERRIPSGVEQRAELRDMFSGKARTRGIKVEPYKEPKIVANPAKKIKTYKISEKKEGITLKRFSENINRVNRGLALKQVKLKTYKPSKLTSISRGVGLGAISVAALAKEQAVAGKRFLGVRFKGTSSMAKRLVQRVPMPNIKSSRMLPPVLRRATVQRTRTKLKLGLSTSQELEQRERQKPMERTAVIQVPTLKTSEETRLKLGQRLNLNQMQLQRQRQRLKQRQLQRTRQFTITPTKPRTRLFTPPGIPKFESAETYKKFGKLKRYQPGYDVFTRQGKKISKTSLTKKAALGFGFKATDVNLKASFFIRPSGRKAVQSRSLERLGIRLAPMFRPSKRVMGLIVEKPRFRLSTGTEVAQIQRARRLKTYSIGRKR